MSSTTTKADILEMACEEMGRAGYEFDQSPEEIASLLRKLDALMLTDPYHALGYNAPASIGASDLSDPSGIGDRVVQTIAIALGIRNFPAMGKAMSPQTAAAFARGINEIRVLTQYIPRTKLRSNTPIGGRRWFGRSYVGNPYGCCEPEILTEGCDELTDDDGIEILEDG